MKDERAYRLYKKLTAGQDAPDVRSAVDRYESALLMPSWLILGECQGPATSSPAGPTSTHWHPRHA